MARKLSGYDFAPYFDPIFQRCLKHIGELEKIDMCRININLLTQIVNVYQNMEQLEPSIRHDVVVGMDADIKKLGQTLHKWSCFVWLSFVIFMSFTVANWIGFSPSLIVPACGWFCLAFGLYRGHKTRNEIKARAQKFYWAAYITEELAVQSNSQVISSDAYMGEIDDKII